MVFTLAIYIARKWNVGKGRRRGLLLKDWIGRGCKREGRPHAAGLSDTDEK